MNDTLRNSEGEPVIGGFRKASNPDIHSFVLEVLREVHPTNFENEKVSCANVLEKTTNLIKLGKWAEHYSELIEDALHYMSDKYSDYTALKTFKQFKEKR